jgi:hypothetical protein
MIHEKSVPFLPGVLVEVRSWPEILSTLDDTGMLEGLPFMPEMARFCGKRFKVSKRIERTCEEAEGGMRRIRNTVFLDALRCDGTAHGGCQKGCFIFWKERWLRRIDQDISSRSALDVESSNQYPYLYKQPDGQYVCQSTELVRATSRLSPMDLGWFLRDIRARTYSVGEMVRNVSYALFLRIRRRLTGKSYRVLEGQQTKTPRETLNLEAGEWVKVKTKDEIASTLDAQGKNRGLAFTVEMLPFCGGTFRVLRRLEKMIHEPTRKLIDLEDTVILENVTCDGCHILRGGCPRDNYHYWREIWLERAQAKEQLTGEPRELRSVSNARGEL